MKLNETIMMLVGVLVLLSAGVGHGIRVSCLRAALLDQQSADTSPSAAAQSRHPLVVGEHRPKGHVCHLYRRLRQRTRTCRAPCRRSAQRHEGKIIVITAFET